MNKVNVTFEEFKQMVRERIKYVLPEEYQFYKVELIENEKIGKGKVTGLVIRNPDSNVAPSIYLDEYYKKMMMGTMKIHDVLYDIVKQQVKIEKQDISEEIEVVRMLQNNFDWDHIKQRIIIEAVNGETNRSLLKNIPHTRIGDIAGVYRIFVKGNEEGRGTILLDNEMFQKLGISLAQLHQKAVENTAVTYPMQIRSLNSIVADMGCDEAAKIAEIPLYVVSTEDSIGGATTIFYPDFAEKVEKIFPQGCYIIPSSIYEVMLAKKEQGVERLTDMVTTVNVCSVAPEDQLSNRIYEYDPVMKTIGLAIKDPTFMDVQKGQHMKTAR